MVTGGGSGGPAQQRAQIPARHLRTDRWWLQPLVTAVVLVSFVAYSTFRAFQNAYYFAEPYISPFYSPCIATGCEGSTFPEFITGPAWISPAIYILWWSRWGCGRRRGRCGRGRARRSSS